jgi:hypothetical protein
MIKKMSVLSFFFVFYFVMYGETVFRVTGKITRNGIGVGNVVVQVSSVFSDKNTDISEEKTRTDNKGDYVIFLKNGTYELNVILWKIENNQFLIPVDLNGFQLPKTISINNKNIMNLNFKIYSELEIIEANRNIFNSFSSYSDSIVTKWGKIPLHPLNDCKKLAEDCLYEKISNKSLIDSDLMKNAKLGPPVVFYDLESRPVYFQFPIILNGVEISFIGIFAVGVTPIEGSFSSQIADTEEELINVINSGNKTTATGDRLIPFAVTNISYQKKCNPENVQVVRLICLNANELKPFYLWTKINPEKVDVLVSLYYKEKCLTDDYSIDQIKESSDFQNALAFIYQYKSIFKLPLISF